MNELIFLKENITENIINAYLASMKYLAGTFHPKVLHNVMKAFNNLELEALDIDELKKYYWYPH